MITEFLAGLNLPVLAAFNAVSPKDPGSRRIATDVSFGSSRRQQLDLYAPRRASGNLPVVVFFYGGSWANGDRRHYTFAGRALAALGYLVVIPDYRVIPEVEYPGFLIDGGLALQWAVENAARYGGDPGRIALMGHSAGAYNAMMVATSDAFLPRPGLRRHLRCIVSLSGPFDFYPFDVPASLRTFGAVEDRRATQPINRVGPDLPPAFLATGDQDTMVHPRNTITMATRLHELGVAVEERHYPGLDHPTPLLALGMIWRRKAPVLADVAQFLRRHLS